MGKSVTGYADGRTHLEKSWHPSDGPDGMKERNREARRLRRAGWEVACETADFSNLGGGTVYYLSAVRP